MLLKRVSWAIGMSLVWASGAWAASITTSTTCSFPGAEGGANIHTQMTKAPEPFGSDGGVLYLAGLSADCPASHFTPRVIPYCPGTKVPLEANQILWYR
jgi:hypothetical protein